MLSHNVFFTLNNPTPETIQSQVEACHKYLSGHEGCIFYAAGPLNTDLTREVNDRDFHVALHVIFESRAAHDAYQIAERHKQFIDENKQEWKQVRVFDSDVTQP